MNANRGGAEEKAGGKARLRRPKRRQMELLPQCVDDLVPRDHSVRTVARVVEELDLSAFGKEIHAREGVAGRDATDPALLVALWLYACTRGVGSAREVARRCEEHLPFRWLCGGVSVNHRLLSEFRTGHEAALDELFTRIIATLVDQELVSVSRIRQDGVRVRVSAGASSFHREEKLRQLLEESKKHVGEVRRQLEEPGKLAAPTNRKKARQHLMDGGYLQNEDIERAQQQGVAVFVPPKGARKAENRGRELEPKPRDSDALRAWTRRMSSEHGQQIYKQRAATSETVNADLRTYRGLGPLTVRGVSKARCVALWCALAYNVMHFAKDLLTEKGSPARLATN